MSDIRDLRAKSRWTPDKVKALRSGKTAEEIFAPPTVQPSLPSIAPIKQGNTVFDPTYGGFKSNKNQPTYSTQNVLSALGGKKDVQKFQQNYKPTFLSRAGDIASNVGEKVGNALLWTGHNVRAGFGQAEQAVSGTLKATGIGQLPGVRDVLKSGDIPAKRWIATANQANQNLGKAGQLGAQALQALPQAAENLALLFLSKGASAPAQLSAATGTTAANILNTVKNPAFINSMVNSFGGTYNQAKESGATEVQAVTTALLTSIPESLIEVGGGVEGIASDLMAGKGIWKTIGKAAGEEAIEELKQYPFQGLAQKATYAPKTPIFSTTEQAIINPVQMAENATVGGLVGGVLGGTSNIMAGKPGKGKMPVQTIQQAAPQPSTTLSSQLTGLPETDKYAKSLYNKYGDDFFKKASREEKQNYLAVLDAEKAGKPIPSTAPRFPIANQTQQSFPIAKSEAPQTQRFPVAKQPVSPSFPVANQQALADIPKARQELKTELDADVQRTLESDEDYKRLVESLEGADIESDETVRQLAKGIVDRWGARYNMTDIYRNISRQNPQFAEYVKKNYLDKFDDAKGRFAFSADALFKQLKDISGRNGIKKGSLMDKALMWYREGQRIVGSDKGAFERLRSKQYDVVKNEQGKEIKIPKREQYTLQDLQRELPNDWQKVVAADQELKQITDKLFVEINSMLKQVYPYVEQQLEPWQKALSDLDAKKNTLSPDAYNSARKQIADKIFDIKKGKRLDYRQNYYHHYREVLTGFSGLKNIFETPAAIDPQLAGISEFTKPKTRYESYMQRRGKGMYEPSAIGSMLKYIMSAEYAININPQVVKFRNLTKNITEGTVNTKNANNMISYLTDFADNLAGKTNNTFFDRFLVKAFDKDRTVVRVLKWMNNRYKGNTVLMNFSSVISQAANIPAALAKIKNPKYIKKAMGQTIANVFGGTNQAIEQSKFVKERYITDVMNQFDARLIDQPKKFAIWLLNGVDKVSTMFVWNGYYNKAMGENNPDPVRYADEQTRATVAGRGIGEVPLWQQSTTFQMVGPFQLEIGNLLHVMSDMVRTDQTKLQKYQSEGAGKVKTFIGTKDFGALAILFILNHIFNNITENITGNRVTFDPIEAFKDAINEDDATFWTVAGRLGGELLSNVPLGQTVATLFPEYPTEVNYGAGSFTLPSRTQLFGENDPTRYGTGIPIAKAVMDPLYKLAMPFGGGQLKKSVEGVKAFAQGKVEKNGKMRFPIAKNVGNALRTSVFGQYSTPEAREYFDQGRAPLSAQQTDKINRMVEAGIDTQTAYDMFRALKRYSKKAQQQAYIRSYKGLSDTQKMRFAKIYFD
jgi:hypothetical protein